MKKLIIAPIFGLIVAVSTSTVFGQGYFTFGGGSRSVTDPFSSPPRFAATFLWSASASTAPIDAVAPFSPPNGSVFISPAGAWADIENLSGSWQFAVDAATGSNAIGVPQNNLGAFSYDSGAAFGLNGSTGPGQVINLYAIAWDTDGGLYDTLAEAEAVDAPVGWSSVFSYTLGSGPPATPPASTAMSAFGIDTPEPATLALIGLGGVSMILIRRNRT